MKIDNIKKLNEEFLSGILSRKNGLLFNLDSKKLIHKIPDSSIQMIYFDPPFSSKNSNDVPHAQDRISNDLSKFVWFIDNKKSFKQECEFYLNEFKRILNKTGSVFIHLPWEQAYDIKPIADEIFGPECFKNEIIWSFRRWSDKSNVLQENHHTILWYCRDNDSYVFNKLEMPKAKSTLKRFGDEKIISAVDKKTGKRVPSETKGKSTTAPLNDVWIWDDNKKNWLYDLEDVDESSYVKGNRINWGISHVAPIKKTTSITGGKYPFEKPAALIERLVKMSTHNENDIVLDFFAGTGVVGEVCKRENRKFILNEISHFTTLDIVKRLNHDILVPGLPLWCHSKYFGKEIKDVDGKEFEFWTGYSLGGISDDSFRGQDTFHGLDVFISTDGINYFPGEVKKRLSSKDEWYKINSKAKKLLASNEFKHLEKIFYIVSTEITKEIQYEIESEKDIHYRLIDLSSPEFNYLLKNSSVENCLKQSLIDDKINKIDKELSKGKSKVIYSKTKSDK